MGGRKRPKERRGGGKRRREKKRRNSRIHINNEADSLSDAKNETDDKESAAQRAVMQCSEMKARQSRR